MALSVAGAAVFTLMYGVTAVGGAINPPEDPRYYWALVPVAGPLIVLNFLPAEAAGFALPVFLLDAAVQFTGLVLMVVGWIAYDSSGRSHADPRVSGPIVRPFLTATARTVGVGLWVRW